MATLSKTRQWIRWETYHQLLAQFDDIEPFLSRNPDLDLTLRPLGIVSNVNTVEQLKMELAAVVDFGEYFVRATYNQESDGPMC